MINVVLWAVLIISLITDLRSRRILNVVTLPAIVFGLVYHSITMGWSGFLFSGIGLSTGLLLLVVPFLLGGIGAGDVKLLAAIGSLTGWLFVLNSFLYTCLAGGMIALIIMIKNKQTKYTLYKMLTITSLRKLDDLDKDEYHASFPYGLAIFIGTAVAYW